MSEIIITNSGAGKKKIDEGHIKKLNELEIQSLKEKLSQYESDNKKLRECVEFYGCLNKWEKEDSHSSEYTMFCAQWNNDYESVKGLLYGGKKARECLKVLG